MVPSAWPFWGMWVTGGVVSVRTERTRVIPTPSTFCSILPWACNWGAEQCPSHTPNCLTIASPTQLQILVIEAAHTVCGIKLTFANCCIILASGAKFTEMSQFLLACEAFPWAFFSLFSSGFSRSCYNYRAFPTPTSNAPLCVCWLRSLPRVSKEGDK